MARAKQASRPRAAASHSRGALHAMVVTFVIVAIALLVVAAPALILLFVGIVPTAVAIFIDRDPQKYAAISVAAMNFAGLAPYLVGFVFGEATFSRAIELVSNVFVLVVIYGAAASGWVLVLALPPVTAIILGVTTENRIQALRKDQERLVEEWGDDVTSRS